MGDPACDAGTLLTSRTPALLHAPDPGKAAHRILDIFGFRVARGGPGLDVIVQFADALAELLARRA
ncbi:hypothetical protein ACWGCP_32820 [Streptomyces niveus]